MKTKWTVFYQSGDDSWAQYDTDLNYQGAAAAMRTLRAWNKNVCLKAVQSLPTREYGK